MKAMQCEETISRKIRNYFNLDAKLQEGSRQIITDYFNDSLLICDMEDSATQKRLFNKSLESLSQLYSPIVINECKPNKNRKLIISNHIGLAKLFKFQLTKLNKNFNDLINNDPFHFILLGPYSYTQMFDNELVPVFTQFQYPSSTVFKNLGFIQIDRQTNGNYSQLHSKVRLTLNDDMKSVICLYPEGGTSGKRSNETIYSLEPFKNGYLNLAKQLNLDLICCTQVFHTTGKFIVHLKNEVHSIRPFMQEKIKELLSYED
ncbi:1-acyl-sn-glycerol-3-phosphate acyltransferase [Roseivirga sp.]|uniref:1-acyl-sn-glycerol-3-phosphate acyltransferase n=1 Tax=Roseivirga sp. TaxID=1964215 RepID=UPI002B273BD9|nr:1-acyl-sn-glycerol-3-phosphate acyltransferase [Roseivirga sp.]